jgi:hypothetical protein
MKLTISFSKWEIYQAQEIMLQYCKFNNSLLLNTQMLEIQKLQIQELSYNFRKPMNY